MPNFEHRISHIEQDDVACFLLRLCLFERYTMYERRYTAFNEGLI
jgi:hypothetical protein